jgi:tetratricopeptide (TPR) repeat protein
VNFGLAAHELGRNDEALKAYLKSAEIDNEYVKAYVNAAALFIEEARWDEAQKACEIALQIEDSDMAKKNLAHVHLAKHEWTQGWKYWELSLGNKYRKEWVYGNEKRWDGTKNQAVVVYGEQGLGDEICYASCVPDAIKDSRKIIIDCDPKLEKLFKRSFPKADVYGTRRNSKPYWLKDARIDARCAISSLPGFYRNKDEDFPGETYLKADPELVRMFKGLFTEWKTNENLQMREADKQEWAKKLPGMPRGLHEELAKITYHDLGATQEGQLQELRRRILEAGETPEAAVQALWGTKLTNAPFGLRQAIIGGMALQGMSSIVSRSTKPVYGLCLHGGSKLTGASWRKLAPEDFSPLFALDAEFISLDYKGHLKHPKIREYQWATQCDDYDLTAALIASLDGVIGVNTTAIHCANGLGIPTHILVPTKKQWRYEPAKDGSYVWSKTAKLYQQGKDDSWRDVIRRVKL